MNKKGQTLIIFVILIPIILTMLAVVVDVGLLTNEYQKARGVVDDGIHEYFESNKENSVKELLSLNEVPTENLEVKTEENKIDVQLSYEISSLFGAIINIKSYKIELHREGRQEEGEVVITKIEK